MSIEKPLSELIATILDEMKKAQFSDETRRQYTDVYRRLQKLADARQIIFYSRQLGQTFINDYNYVGTNKYSHHRFYFHKRCIHILENLIYAYNVDWSPCPYVGSERSFIMPSLKTIHDDYIKFLKDEGMSQSSICSYGRVAFYLLKYIEEKGYLSLDDLCPGDVTDFIVTMCREHWNPKCLGSYISGLKKLLNMSDRSSTFIKELPAQMPRKKDIIEVYTDREHEQIFNYLQGADIPIRNKAICFLSMETGLRAIDISNLKLRDVDWKNEVIHLVQMKTGHAIHIPLRASYGNAMADYLLNERPVSPSPYFFLQRKAPFGKIDSHSCIYCVLRDVVRNAGVKKEGRINGTRMMRHNVASRMVRKGVSLPAISKALGHTDPNSTLTYISTDSQRLCECTLSVPNGRGM